MKDAASEANMTVLAIILIAVIAAVVTPIISNAMKTTQKKSCCSNAGGVWRGNACTDGGTASGAGSAYDAATYNECISSSGGAN